MSRVEAHLKGNHLRTAMHWPKGLVKGVREMQKKFMDHNVLTKDNEILEKGRTHYMVRPCLNTKKVKILYRKVDPNANAKDWGKFNLLESVPYPVDEEFRKKYGYNNERIEHSCKFFTGEVTIPTPVQPSEGLENVEPMEDSV